MNREAFEKSYAEAHDLPLDTFSQYRMGDTYRLPGIASHWRTWCAALESVVVELPEPMKAPDQAWNESTQRAEKGKFMGFNRALRMAKKAIKVAGVRVKP